MHTSPPLYLILGSTISRSSSFFIAENIIKRKYSFIIIIVIIRFDYIYKRVDRRDPSTPALTRRGGGGGAYSTCSTNCAMQSPLAVRCGAVCVCVCP